MKENFTNIKNDPLVAAAAKILTGCTQLDETGELQEMSNTKIAKDIKKGDSFKANLKIPGKGVDISKAYTVIATDDAMDSKTHPGKLVNIRVKAGNYTTVVPFEKNQKVDLVEETIDEAAPKGDNLQKLNDISKIFFDVEENLKQRDLAQKKYDNALADLYVLFDKRENLHDMLKYSNLGFSKSQIDKAYKGKL